MVVPCKKCQNKGCGAYHGKCEAYIAFQEQQKKAYKERVMAVQNAFKRSK